MTSVKNNGFRSFDLIDFDACQSLAYSPLGAQYRPLAGSSKKQPCYHLANVDILTRSLIDALLFYTVELWRYWSETQQIYIRCRLIIAAINAHIYIVIFQFAFKS